MPYKYVRKTTIKDEDSHLSSIGLGRTNERIGRIQESYVANATSSSLESLERSLAQMKEYQVRTLLGT